MYSQILTIPQFYMTHPYNERDLYIYLPPSYEREPKRHYPVLYVYDGQHVFSAEEFGEAWDLQQIVDRLTNAGEIDEIIVVAVAGRPVAWEQQYQQALSATSRALGRTSSEQADEEYLTGDVKPFVDGVFRTRPEPEHSALMGFYAGGSISYTIGLRHPNVFGKIALLSPSFIKLAAGDSQGWQLSLGNSHDQPQQVWIDIGGPEGLLLTRQERAPLPRLLEHGYACGDDLLFFYTPEGGSGQQDWAARVHVPLLRFFGTT